MSGQRRKRVFWGIKIFRDFFIFMILLLKKAELAQAATQFLFFLSKSTRKLLSVSFSTNHERILMESIRLENETDQTAEDKVLLINTTTNCFASHARRRY